MLKHLNIVNITGRLLLSR